MPVEFLVREARVNNLQNRLGFVVTLGQRATERNDLQQLEYSPAESKLANEDTFCKDLNAAEHEWFRGHRSHDPREWNLLSDLRPDAVCYVAQPSRFRPDRHRIQEFPVSSAVNRKL